MSKRPIQLTRMCPWRCAARALCTRILLKWMGAPTRLLCTITLCNRLRVVLCALSALHPGESIDTLLTHELCWRTDDRRAGLCHLGPEDAAAAGTRGCGLTRVTAGRGRSGQRCIAQPPRRGVTQDNIKADCSGSLIVKHALNVGSADQLAAGHQSKPRYHYPSARSFSTQDSLTARC